MKTARSDKERQSPTGPRGSASGLLTPALWLPEGVQPVLKRLIVLGPYPTKEFFQDIVRVYDPKEILLVVDEGCNRDEVDRIASSLGSRKFQVRYASCRNCGLLHAKVYLAEWVSGGTTKQRLLWGSLNASRNGFQVNGEVVSAVTLEADQERIILPYFRQLWEGLSGSVQALDMNLTGGVRFHLPEFQFSVTPEPETFDAWVQAGRLCYKFQRDQTFAKLSLKLLNPLPPDAFQNLFTEADLREDTDRDTFRFPYLGDVVTEDGRSVPHWRASYFLETWLGFWTSDACYNAKKGAFTVQNEQQRKEVLTRIKQGVESDHRDWFERFVQCLRQALNGLRGAKEEPREFFKMREKDIDISHYRMAAFEELKNHRKRAQNSIFEERFTTGYEFHPLPRFRGAEAAEGGSFEDFVECLCESILNGLMRRKHTNQIVQAVGRKLDRIDVAQFTGRELADFLRRNWHLIGGEVRAFYK